MPARRPARSTRQQAVEGEFGPVARGRVSRRSGWPWGRVALTGVAVLAALALAGGGTVAWVLWYGTQQVGRIDVDHLRRAGDVDGNGTIDVEELTDVLTILVVGSDSRDGLTDDQLEALGTDRETGRRSDTIMLVQLDPRRDEATLLSFPRDLLVTRCDGSEGKVNAAYGIGERTGVGGPTCLVGTITEFTGIPINHYVEVDFAGFIEIVEAIGGVSLYLDEPLVDPYAGLDLPTGCVELDGNAALGFVRTRIDSDFGRIARQQRFLREVAAEAASVGTLVNVPRLLSLVDAVGKAVDADQDLTGGHMRRIAMSLRTMDTATIDMRTVPGEARRIDGLWYVVPDTDAAGPLFTALRESRTVPGDVGTSEVADSAGEQVAVGDVPALTVLNGVGEAGLGARAAAALRELGFTIDTVANADRYDHERTVVSHPSGLAGHAEVVAEALGGAELEAVEEAAVNGGAGGGELTVVLGGDYRLPDASAAVQRERRPAAAPSDSASPAAPSTPSYQAATPSEHRC